MHKALRTVSVLIEAQTLALVKNQPVDLGSLRQENVEWLIAGGYVAPIKGELRTGETPEDDDDPALETRTPRKGKS